MSWGDITAELSTQAAAFRLERSLIAQHRSVGLTNIQPGTMHWRERQMLWAANLLAHPRERAISTQST